MTHTIYRGRSKAQVDPIMDQRWQERVGAHQELLQFQITHNDSREASTPGSAGANFDAVLSQIQQVHMKKNTSSKLLAFGQPYLSSDLYQIPTLNTYINTETHHPETERMQPDQAVMPVAYIVHS
jgi:hypothetical protein